MSRAFGFSLIEMMVVVTILSILAVAGAEKILNQQVDAEAHNAMLNQLAAKL